MILRELFYYDKDENGEDPMDSRYNPSDDKSVMKKSFNRRTRLTLKQINRARRASELHDKERSDELVNIRKMYGIISQANMTNDGGNEFGGI